MKLRWWPHTCDARIASTRLRCLRIVDALRAQGLDACLYDPAETAPDVLVLSKRYDADSLTIASALQTRGTRVVLDLCDNHFYCEPPTPAWTRRATLLRDAVARVDAVIVATPALAEIVRAECPAAAPILYTIGDAVEPPWSPQPARRWRHQLDEWALCKLAEQVARQRAQGSISLLWFGNQGSDNAEGGLLDLLRIAEPLHALAQQQPTNLTVISNHRGKFEAVARALPLPCRYLPWRATTFSRATALHDIALLPVSLNPFTTCKTNNRVATALMHGVAVVADPVPSYREFDDCIVLGDWGAGLRMLAACRARRAAGVERGRARIAAHWGLDTIAGHWRTALEQVAPTPATDGARNAP